MRNLDENTITAATISRHEQCEDPRTKVLMTKLVQSLHDFAREVQLTEEEWAMGIAFLTSVGKKCSRSGGDRIRCAGDGGRQDERKSCDGIENLLASPLGACQHMSHVQADRQ